METKGLKYPNDYWQTPPVILDAVNAFYGGDWFDPCPANADFDGLAMGWPAKTFINPPFSQYLKWIQHGLRQPFEQIWIFHHDSSTQRVQRLLPGALVCLLFDRVSFIHPDTGKPKGTDPAKSQTLIYRGDREREFWEVFRHLGAVYEEFQPLRRPKP